MGRLLLIKPESVEVVDGFLREGKSLRAEMIRKEIESLLDVPHGGSLLALLKGFRIQATVISIGYTYSFTPQVSSSRTGHQELANSTYLLWPPDSRDHGRLRAHQEAKAGEPQ
jgi:hypothetical protein